MTESFQGYKEDFSSYCEQAMEDIREISKISDNQRRMNQTQKANTSISEAERYYRILESESRAGSSQERRKMQQQLRSCKSKLDKLHANLERAALIADSKERSKATPASNDPKDNAINYQKRMDRNGNYLTEAQRTIAETEQVAVNIDTNLARQREHIQKAQENVQETRANTKEAGTHLSSMSRKAFTNSIVLWTVIILLLAAIGYMVYSRFIKKGTDTATSGSGSGTGGK